MEIQRFNLKVLFAILPLFIFACEDPSNVGLGLVGDGEGGIPQTRVIPINAFEPIADDGVRDNTSQVLAGQVIDPAFGTIKAEGFIDVRSNLDLPDSYENGTVEGALLYLVPNYFYGDSTQVLTFALHEVLSEFESSGNSQDSIPETGPELMQFDFDPTQSLLQIPLPDTWVNQYEADLRSSSFGDVFHGFKIVPVAGNAVVGFVNTIGTATLADNTARLQGIAAGDTVDYVADKSITTFSKLADPDLPADRTILQNGLAPQISLNFSLDSLALGSLNRGALELRIDTGAMETPANFLRPELNTLLLGAIVKSDSNRVIVAEGNKNDDDSYSFVFNDNIVVFLSSSHQSTYPQYVGLDFHDVLQDILLGGENPFMSYEVLYPITATSNTLEGLVLHNPTSATDAPNVYLTTTPR